MSYLVANPEGRFSRVEAHIVYNTRGTSRLDLNEFKSINRNVQGVPQSIPDTKRYGKGTEIGGAYILGSSKSGDSFLIMETSNFLAVLLDVPSLQTNQNVYRLCLSASKGDASLCWKMTS